MTDSSWSAVQYTKFEAERTRPVRDLVAQIPTAAAAICADLGCGPGNSTEVLQARFPDAAIIGIDNSVDMIEAARKRLPAIRFEIADIDAWVNSGPFDVILANASLQWVPGHECLLPALLSKLAPAGSLAVQIPDNLDEPAHCLMREIAAGGPWRRNSLPLQIHARAAAAPSGITACFALTLPLSISGGRFTIILLLAAPLPWSSGSKARAFALSRPARQERTFDLPRPLRDLDCTRLYGIARRYRAVALSEALFRRDALKQDYT